MDINYKKEKEGDDFKTIKTSQDPPEKTARKLGELEKMKMEILEEVKPKEQSQRLHWGSAVVTIVLAVLAFTSIAQAAQTTNIMQKINSGAVSASSESSASTALPSSLESLPDMVGGC